MPKLNVKNPVLGAKEGRAVVRYKGRTHYLKKPDGTSCKPNTKEALIAYNRLCIELQKNSGYIAPRGYAAPAGESDVTIAAVITAVGKLWYVFEGKGGLGVFGTWKPPC